MRYIIEFLIKVALQYNVLICDIYCPIVLGLVEYNCIALYYYICWS